MKVFVSYASEDRAVAEQVVRSLRNRHHDVFYDKDRLPVGKTYEDRIEKEIGRSDVFVFLVSPHSVEPGTFALTEARIAERRWERPDSRVLPVQIAPTEIDKLPFYLRSVTIYKPVGDIAADTAIEVERMRRNWWSVRRAGLVAVATVGVVAGSAWMLPWEQWNYLDGRDGTMKVQAALCLPPTAQTGKYDAATGDALAEFRQAQASKVTGAPTFPEWQYLLKAGACPSQYQNAFERFAYPDAPSIKVLQRSLIESCLSAEHPPAETGTFDQETRRAISQVRARFGMSPDSKMTPEVSERLKSAVENARKRSATVRTKIEDALNKVAAIDDYKRQYLYTAFKNYEDCQNSVSCKGTWQALQTQLTVIYDTVKNARIAISSYSGDLFGDGAKLDFTKINKGLGDREALVLRYLDPNEPAPDAATAKRLEAQHKQVAEQLEKELRTLKAKLDNSCL